MSDTSHQSQPREQAQAINNSQQVRTPVPRGSIYLKGGRTRVNSFISSKPRDDRSIISFRSSDIGRRKVLYENTYRMTPKETFPHEAASRLIHEVLENNLKNMDYQPAIMGAKARLITDFLKEKMKGLKLERYKLVCWAMLGEKRDNGIRAASRELWDTRSDNFACASYETSELYAVGVVYAIYQE